MKERLQKAMASAGVASRRKCEAMIREGRVRVNGLAVQEMGVQVDLEVDEIRVDETTISGADKLAYVMLHKPPGVVSTAHDERGRTSVIDMVEARSRLYPVGRLDIDSEGLILLTNDGAVAHVLTHPSFEHEKEYRALVRGFSTRTALGRLTEGVQLEDGVARVDHVQAVTECSEGTWLNIVMHEGKKRQIRRMCAAVGLSVLRLVRVRMGPLHLGDLEVGKWRLLTDQERRAIAAMTNEKVQ